MPRFGAGEPASYRANLVFDDVLYAPISNLTHQERAYLGLILFSSYTKRALPKNSSAVEALLSEEARLSERVIFRLQKLSQLSGLPLHEA